MSKLEDPGPLVSVTANAAEKVRELLRTVVRDRGDQRTLMRAAVQSKIIQEIRSDDEVQFNLPKEAE